MSIFILNLMRKYKICQQFGRKVKRLRKRKSLSQEDFASNVGIHRTYMGKIERGESNPPLHTIYKIAKALKTHISELFRF